MCRINACIPTSVQSGNITSRKPPSFQEIGQHCNMYPKSVCNTSRTKPSNGIPAEFPPVGGIENEIPFSVPLYTVFSQTAHFQIVQYLAKIHKTVYRRIFGQQTVLVIGVIFSLFVVVVIPFYEAKWMVLCNAEVFGLGWV